MVYTVFLNYNGHDSLELLGEFTREQLEDLTIIKEQWHQGVRKEDLTVVAGEIVELW